MVIFSPFEYYVGFALFLSLASVFVAFGSSELVEARGLLGFAKRTGILTLFIALSLVWPLLIAAWLAYLIFLASQ